MTGIWARERPRGPLGSSSAPEALLGERSSSARGTAGHAPARPRKDRSLPRGGREEGRSLPGRLKRRLLPTRPAGRSLRTRLLVFIAIALAVVCATMALTTVLAQRSYLLDNFDQRVTDAAERSQAGLQSRAGQEQDSGLRLPEERGQAVGTLAARLDDQGTVIAAEVVTQDGGQKALTAAQRAALDGVTANGTLHTRTVPGLGTYRVTARGAGVPVLTGLPTTEVQDMIRRLIVIDSVVAGAGLVVAGCVCSVVIRRQLRPLGRVAATAVEVSRTPLGHGEVTGLVRVPDRDTDPASEAGQVGAALNLMIDHVESSLVQRLSGEEQLRRSEERMRRFVADASHELRTPLASIAGYAELMNRGAGQIEPTLAWSRVSVESARMTGLVEDLLLLARLDEGRPLQSGEVDLAAVVTEAVWDARADGDGHNWQLALLDSPALVRGDEARLQQVLANLLANARVHTPVGTTVVTSVETMGAHCVVRVIDDGPGIPQHLLPTVFERFTRGDTSRSRSDPAQGGSGLGLAIVAAIATAHGGRVHVESVPGRTEFRTELPAAQGAEDAKALWAAESGAVAETPGGLFRAADARGAAGG